MSIMIDPEQSVVTLTDDERLTFLALRDAYRRLLKAMQEHDAAKEAFNAATDAFMGRCL